MVSVCGDFVFHRAISEEIDGCVSCGRFSEYVDFNEMNVTIFPTNLSEEFREKLSLMYIGLH